MTCHDVFWLYRADLVGQLNRNGQKGMLQIDAVPVENVWLRHWLTACVVTRSSQRIVYFSWDIDLLSRLWDVSDTSMGRFAYRTRDGERCEDGTGHQLSRSLTRTVLCTVCSQSQGCVRTALQLCGDVQQPGWIVCNFALCPSSSTY